MKCSHKAVGSALTHTACLYTGNIRVARVVRLNFQVLSLQGCIIWRKEIIGGVTRGFNFIELLCV